MVDFAFYVLWILAFSALQVITWSWGEIKRLKETMYTWSWGEIKRLKETMYAVEAVLPGEEKRRKNSEALRNWLETLVLLKNDWHLLDEIEREVRLWNRGSAGRKFCRFFSSSNLLVFCLRIGYRIKKMRERIDEIAAERDSVNLVLKRKNKMPVRRDLLAKPKMLLLKPKNKMPVRRHLHAKSKMFLLRCSRECEVLGSQVENGSEETYSLDVPATMVIDLDEDPEIECEVLGSQVENGSEGTYSLDVPATVVTGLDEDLEIECEVLGSQVENGSEETYSLDVPASVVIDLDEDPAKQIVYVVVCIVAVCVDPFFLYIPFLSHTKMCLGINTELWKVAVALRTVTDFFTALILLPQLRRCMSSIKSILLMCVKYLALAPIPQILFSEKFILKTLRGYTFWNLSLFCQCGIRLVLIFQAWEQLKTRVSVKTLVWFNAPVYLFLYLIVSHVIGAFWYYLSIKRQLSCWNYACKIITGCILPCDGTTPPTLNSTLYNQFCPINPPNASVFNYGIYLDALQSRIVEEEGVLKKFMRCFFWGLRNLSTFASNLHTSMSDGETFFAIIISAVALILLMYILGNIQRYAELESARSERIVDKMEPIKDLLKCLHNNVSNLTCRLKDDEDVNLTMRDVGFGFPVESRSANSATERVDSSSRTEEARSVQVVEV